MGQVEQLCPLPGRSPRLLEEAPEVRPGQGQGRGQWQTWDVPDPYIWVAHGGPGAAGGCAARRRPGASAAGREGPRLPQPRSSRGRPGPSGAVVGGTGRPAAPAPGTGL